MLNSYLSLPMMTLVDVPSPKSSEVPGLNVSSRSTTPSLAAQSTIRTPVTFVTF